MRILLKVFLSLSALLICSQISATACHPQLHSNIGCEFYAVTLPNPVAAQAEEINSAQYDFGVVFLDASATNASDITVTGGDLTSPQSVHLNAGAYASDVLPKNYSIWQDANTEVFTSGAFHIVSSNPITAAQFNTLNPASGSNDVSLLLPVQGSGTSFRAVTWPTEILGGGFILSAQLGIVATQQNTSVQVQVPGSFLLPGAGLTSSGGTISLNAGDLLILSAAATSGTDLSGTLITSSAPILVWSSHAGADIPDATAAADHLEEALPPVAALGQDYLIARPTNPSGSSSGASQYIKLVGTADNTNLVFDPPQPGAPAVLQAGYVVTFAATSDFHLHADQRVLVAQFMESANAFVLSNANGDPSETIAVPTEQAQREVDFFAPQTFSPNYAQVIAPNGANISVDGTAVSSWTAIGSSGFNVAHVSVCCTDIHHASGDQPFILSAYSYPSSGYTSYWYPAALGIADDIFADGFE